MQGPGWEEAPGFGELQGGQCGWSRRWTQRGVGKLQSWKEARPWGSVATGRTVAFILSVMQVAGGLREWK